MNISLKSKKLFSFMFLCGFADMIHRWFIGNPESTYAIFIVGALLYHFWLWIMRDLKE